MQKGCDNFSDFSTPVSLCFYQKSRICFTIFTLLPKYSQLSLCILIAFTNRRWIVRCIQWKNSKLNINKNSFQEDAYRPLQWLSRRGRGCVPGGGVCRSWVSAQGDVHRTGPRGRHPPDPEAKNIMSGRSKYSSLEQDCVLQLLFSVEIPPQLFPPYCGLGLLCNLDRILYLVEFPSVLK